MTLKEILIEKGLTEETAEDVLAAMKANKLFTASEENMDIRYGKLKDQHAQLTKQLAEANAAMETLKGEKASYEENAQKSAENDALVSSLREELERTKVNAALKLALLSGKAQDIDYLSFKLSEKLKADGETLELDDGGNIKGWNEKLEALKLQYPKMFESTVAEQAPLKVLSPNRLQEGVSAEALSREEILKKPYQERARLFNENPDAFREAMNK